MCKGQSPIGGVGTEALKVRAYCVRGWGKSRLIRLEERQMVFCQSLFR